MHKISSKWLHELFNRKLEKRKNSIGNHAGRLFIVFMVIMFLLTILSRIADSLTIPKVQVDKVMQKSLDFNIKGSGTIGGEANNFAKVLTGIRVVNVYVKQGDVVKKGDSLFQYDSNGLKDQLDTIKHEIEQMKADIEKSKLNEQVQNYQNDSSQDDTAASTVETAKREIADTAQEIENQKAQISNDKKNECENAKKEYERAKTKLESLKNNDASSGEIQEQQFAVEDAKQTYEKAKDVYAKIVNQTYDFSNDLKDLTTQLKSSEQALADAQNALSKLEEQKDKQKKIESLNNQMTNLDNKVAQSKIVDKQEEADEIQQLIDANGIVTASEAGTVLECNLESGLVTTGVEKLSFAGNKSYFKGVISRDDAKKIVVGDKIELEEDQEGNSSSVIIESIGNPSKSRENAEGMEQQSDQESEEMTQLSGKITDGNYKVGSNVNFSIDKKSKVYVQTVPIQALHMEGNENYFVLVTEKKETILGKELFVQKIEVTVLDKDYKTAAIQSSLTSDNQIIVNSSKNISAGDRIRIINNDKKTD
ncbi:HlyD family secretion protein [Anaerosacchariphilus polymeriproducens]|uniref:Biotin/lipoyl-binding protein n=1 Tax=Anaerosacchariphilus polymeriproducens TaxID=1812858 RepID=A0A371ART2_9FIRM|nr:biotin/lipoyl-binding protein [Anaerosacchariphilus polymeriproducens]RDU22276.1 biotin/lipoyl-binding protein [Anaerosacchariphilus polymeriproducens]